MAIEKLVENFANATGIIIDHTLNPPRVLGQAFLVSKSKLVTCAGCIFNYVEAPWALSINFPHPGLVLGVKSITLHPEFDRKEARMSYLNQTAVTKYSYPVQFNDLATLVLQGERKQPLPEEIVQLHKALSLPFSREGVELSGALSESEFLEVVKKLLAGSRQGLLTLYDELNIPVAYIQFSPSAIEHIYFQGIVGEMAFAELICRQPAGGFAFQPNYNFAWGDLRKIEMSAQDLIAESIRRSQELPSLFNQLGGAQAVYQKVVKEFSAESFNPNIQWLVNNLWYAIDGYLSLSNLSERVGADTYTVIQGVRELSNHGVISLINRTSPFHLGGQLGSPIISHTDFDINPGDALKAFYLDPVSGAPCWQDGDFAGVSSVLQAKNLLHSIPLNLRVPGALILKNYKLIGVHNGAVQMKAGQTQTDRQLFQMMWIGALFDMASKRLRSATDIDEENEAAQSTSGSKLSTLRVRGEEEAKVAVEKLEKYVCQNCFANNTKLGNCFNCGALIGSVPTVTEEHGFFVDKLPIKVIRDLQKKYQISDRNTFIALGAIAVLLLFLLSSIFNSGSGPRKPAPVVTQTDNRNAEKAVKLAVDTVGFKGIAPPGYWFEDTTSATSPLPSFGIFSDASNQKILFIIFNDLSPVQALDRFTQIPPFTEAMAPNPQTSDKAVKITEGSQIVGEGDFRYYVHVYPLVDKTSKAILVGSFPAKEAGKSVLVIGQALKEGNYDYKSTLFLIDAMAEPMTLAANAKRTGSTKAPSTDSNSLGSNNTTVKKDETNNSEANSSAQKASDKIATDEELNKYCETLQNKFEKKAEQSSLLQETIKKRKVSKLKLIIDVDLDEDGNLHKIEFIEPDADQKINEAIVKIIKTSSLYEDVPKVEGGVLSLRVVFNKKEGFKVELR